MYRKKGQTKNRNSKQHTTSHFHTCHILPFHVHSYLFHTCQSHYSAIWHSVFSGICHPYSLLSTTTLYPYLYTPKTSILTIPATTKPQFLITFHITAQYQDAHHHDLARDAVQREKLSTFHMITCGGFWPELDN